MKWNKEDEAYQNLHAAAMMGNAMAKVEEAKCFEEGNGTKKDRLRAQQLADDGYATITWLKSKGAIINCLTLDRFLTSYMKEDLELKDGGTYTICMDCK